jgi:superfamily II DNA or RNA helicase
LSKRTCKIRILDEVYCVVVGLTPDHVGYFYEEYAVHSANYFFNPKFKLGQWDGKIRYFHKTGKTYVNLLEEIIPRIVALQYNVEIEDQRQNRFVTPTPIDTKFFEHITDPSTGEPWEVRDYQVELVNALLEHGNGVGIAGTGSGKTSMTAALALAYEKAAGMKSIIIVPDKNLTSQTFAEYEYFGMDVGEYSGTRKDLDHQHIVSTWQALQNNPNIIQGFQVVVVDECHGIRGNVLTKILNDYGSHIAHRFGVTGTLPKDPTDALAVKVAVGPVHYVIPAHKLIEEGYLSSLHIDIFQHDVDLTGQYEDFLTENPIPKPTYKQFKDAYFPDWSAEKRYLQTNQTRLEWIAQYIQLSADQGKGNVLCLVNGVNMGKKLAKMIEGAHFVYGKDDMKVRKEIYDMFKDNDNVIVIATVNIASTGLNIPRIFNMIFIDIGKSFIRTIQSIGRALRKAHDKDHARISDICSDFKYSKRHLRDRIKYYKEAQYPYKKRVVPLTERETDVNF